MTKTARKIVKPFAKFAEKRATKQLNKLPATIYQDATLTALKKVVTNSKNNIEENRNLAY